MSDIAIYQSRFDRFEIILLVICWMLRNVDVVKPAVLRIEPLAVFIPSYRAQRVTFNSAC